LSYLQMLPVNGLKLAQEFVETLPGGDTESGLVRTIRDLADTLGLSTIVAEGIEKPEQWSSLLSLGYRIGQGFHLAVPMPAERVPEFLSGLSNPGDGDWERSVLAAAEAAAPTAADPVTTGEAPQDENHQDPQVAATDIGATEVAAVASAKSTRA
jgi:predicted signal transduction protein with EAL and GGDEF domain